MNLAKRSAIDILDQERAFNIDELFFSITDKKGVIQQCNDVFTRISAYTTEEVIGAPHSILRHPDMPRAIFKLLWDTIEAGQIVAAYVKNLAKDGRYYWVLALVMPTENGYLSIRLKPVSPLFPIVRSVYSEMLSIERVIETEPKRRPEAMAAATHRLGELLNEHGFRDYNAFMQTALSTEMVARQEALKHHPASRARGSNNGGGDYAAMERMRLVTAHFAELDQNLQNLFQYLDEFRSMNVLLLDKSRSMLDNAAVIRLLSLNATVAANQLGARAQTLGVVAQSLGEASIHSEQIIAELAKEMNSLVNALSTLIFEVATIKLQSEVSNYYLKEMHSGCSVAVVGHLDSVTASLNILVREVSKRTSAVYEQLSASEMCFAILRKRVEQLLRNVNTLRFVQFAGLKESVSLNGAEAFAVVFEEAKLQIDKTRQECDQLCERVEASQKHIRSIRGARSEVLSHTSAMISWADSLGHAYS
ncbi:MAG: PAS domain-containing protein [Pirellulaceae bacterium]|nr:PAS domain-containing protein [Pirellulaceae bacterium]